MSDDRSRDLMKMAPATGPSSRAERLKAAPSRQLDGAHGRPPRAVRLTGHTNASSIWEDVVAKLELDPVHASDKLSLKSQSVRARMGTPMAIRAQRDNGLRVVWTTVAHSLNVMRLQIRYAVFPQEWSRLGVVFTKSSGPTQHIVSNMAAALINRRISWTARYRRLRCIVRKLAKCIQIDRQVTTYRRGDIIDNLFDVFQRPQPKNDGVSFIPILVRSPTPFIAGADIFAHESEAITILPEKKQAFRVDGMLQNGLIAPRHNHVANTSSAKILKATVGQFSVMIAVVQSALARCGNDKFFIRRSYYTSLFLPAEVRMDVSPAVVPFPSFKSPSHLNLLAFSTAYIGRKSCIVVKEIS